jgi:pseudouridine-5'-phosphate glycosidase
MTTINLHPDVEVALRQNRPVVALESTLITHGFPRPDNLQIAQAIEQAVRDQGAVPATVAILDGQFFVGLTNEQLTHLAETDAVRKCSVRDLPLVLAQKGNGGTTVAATMIMAYQAGIQVFATGGIGGVHRNIALDRHNGHHAARKETLIYSWDVSADLTELGRTPITVVCAGMKAFLDLPATLEYLETIAVPVLGYGVDELPAFYSRSSGLPLDERVDTPQAMADIIRVRDSLGLSNAILVTVPVPVVDEWPASQAEPIIEKALVEAQTRQISGKEATPFLLSRIAELSGRLSKQANESLLINNARVGAEIAKAYCALPEA